MNSSFFSEPGESWPERWLDYSRLDRHLLAFSRGTRVFNGYLSPYIGSSANLPIQTGSSRFISTHRRSISDLRPLRWHGGPRPEFGFVSTSW